MRNVFFYVAAFFVLGGVLLSCNGNDSASSDESSGSEAVVEAVSVDESIAHYLADSIAPSYARGEVCIPSVNVIAVDSADVNDVKVWGDYWVFNYNVSGDTLKTVSGGSHAGLIHLKRSDSGYVVTAFEQVEDGSRYLSSAQRIFGDKFDAFKAINGDDKKREELRRVAIEEYVKRHRLSVSLYQDYGWPARDISI